MRTYTLTHWTLEIFKIHLSASDNECMKCTWIAHSRRTLANNRSTQIKMMDLVCLTIVINNETSFSNGGDYNLLGCDNWLWFVGDLDERIFMRLSCRIRCSHKTKLVLCFLYSARSHMVLAIVRLTRQTFIDCVGCVNKPAIPIARAYRVPLLLQHHHHHHQQQQQHRQQHHHFCLLFIAILAVFILCIRACMRKRDGVCAWIFLWSECLVFS